MFGSIPRRYRDRHDQAERAECGDGLPHVGQFFRRGVGLDRRAALAMTTRRSALESPLLVPRIAAAERDLTVGGPTLGAHAITAGLVDEDSYAQLVDATTALATSFAPACAASTPATIGSR